jgi:hypothetical protein
MLTMRQKNAVTRELQERKTVILNEFIRLTDYHRSYAAQVLRKKKILGYLSVAGQKVKYGASGQKRKKMKYNVITSALRGWSLLI